MRHRYYIMNVRAAAASHLSGRREVGQVETLRKLLGMLRRIDLTPRTREEFRQFIAQVAVEDDRKTLSKALTKVPDFTRPVLRPALWLYLGYVRGREKERGEEGEEHVSEALARLGSRWVIARSVVLRDGEYWVESDILCLGPAGVAPVEVKHWGHWVRLGLREAWIWQHEFRKWQKRESPINQVLRTTEAIRKRLHSHGIDVPLHPIVVMVGTRKIDKTREAPEDLGVPVFFSKSSLQDAIQHLKSLPRVVDESMLERVIDALRDPQPTS